MFEPLKDIYSILWVDLRNLSHHWRSTVATSLIQPVLYLLAFGYGLGRGVTVDGVSYLAFVIPGIVVAYGFFIKLQRRRFKTSNRPPLLPKLRRILDFADQLVLHRRGQSAHRHCSRLNQLCGYT